MSKYGTLSSVPYFDEPMNIYEFAFGLLCFEVTNACSVCLSRAPIENRRRRPPERTHVADGPLQCADVPEYGAAVRRHGDGGIGGPARAAALPLPAPPHQRRDELRLPHGASHGAGAALPGRGKVGAPGRTPAPRCDPPGSHNR